MNTRGALLDTQYLMFDAGYITEILSKANPVQNIYS